MRVALYAWVSTKEKGQDIANQLHQLRAFAEQHGSIYKVFSDQKVGVRPTVPSLNTSCLRPTKKSSTWCSGA